MDNALFSASLLLLLVAAGAVWCARGTLIPGMITPFAELNDTAQLRVSRRKLHLRFAALALFALAAASLFSMLPRGVTLAFVLAGFFCQYKVFCLRRRYPLGLPPGEAARAKEQAR